MVRRWHARVTTVLMLPDDFLTTPNEMHQAIDKILDSELFNFHSERMLALLMKTCEDVRRTRSAFIQC